MSRVRATQAWLRPGLALAMAYVFVLQTVVALSLFTAHISSAALAGVPAILCLTEHYGGTGDVGGIASQGATAPGKETPGTGTPGKGAPDAPCPLCAFAGANFTSPSTVDFQPLDRVSLRVTTAFERAFALRSPAPTPRLSQGPPRTT